MFANQLYDQMSLMRFQVSILSLGVALEQAVPIGVGESSSPALVEVDRLKNLMEASDC